MIDVINEMCVNYGRQMRRVCLGGYMTDTGFHFDGASPRSVMDKVWEGHGSPVQYFPEVLEGDALIVRRACQGLIEHRQYLLNLHYVLPRRFFPTKRKVQVMADMFPEKYSSKRHYYENIDKLHVWIAARVPCESESPDVVRTEYLRQSA
jgi:hypothetical protein